MDIYKNTTCATCGRLAPGRQQATADITWRSAAGWIVTVKAGVRGAQGTPLTVKLATERNSGHGRESTGRCRPQGAEHRPDHGAYSEGADQFYQPWG